MNPKRAGIFLFVLFRGCRIEPDRIKEKEMYTTDSLMKALNWYQMYLYTYFKKFRVGSEMTQKRRKLWQSTIVILRRFKMDATNDYFPGAGLANIFGNIPTTPCSLCENTHWQTQLCWMHSETSKSTFALGKQSVSAHSRPGSTAASLTFLAQARLTPGGWREAAGLLARTGAHSSPGTTLSLFFVVTWDYR